MAGEGSATYSNLTPGIYKQRWPNGVTWAGLMQAVFYNRCKKSTNFGADFAYITVQLTAGSGGSSKFDKALNNRNAGTTAKFSVSPGHDYVIGSISNEVLAGGKNEAIIDEVLHQFDMKGQEFGELIDRRILSENGGCMGRCAASGGVSGATIVVRTKSQARNFRAGMRIEASSAATAATLRTNVYTVSSVNVGTKTITMTETIVGWSNSDYVTLEGETGEFWSGLLSWVSTTAPSGTTIGANVTCSSDLSVDSWRLGGFRPSAGACVGSLTKTLKNCCSEMTPYGIKVSDKIVLVSPIDYDRIIDEINNPVYDVVKSNVDATVGFDAVRIQTSAGKLNIVADPRYIDDQYTIVNPGDWTLLSRGPYPAIPNRSSMVLESTADAWQFRFVGYACLIPTDVSLRETATGVFKSAA